MRGRVNVNVQAELVASAFIRGRTVASFACTSGLPDDAEIVAVSLIDGGRVLQLTFASSMLPAALEGDCIPLTSSVMWSHAEAVTA